MSSSKFHTHPELPAGLLVTAKGFPDIATRELLSMINEVPYHQHNLTTRLPVFCIVDDDPYGLNIYGVYKYGGEKNSHMERERLVLPNLTYLGIMSGDFEDNEDRVIELTRRDQRKVEMMLKKDWVQREPEIL